MKNIESFEIVTMIAISICLAFQGWFVTSGILDYDNMVTNIILILIYFKVIENEKPTQRFN